MRLRLVALTLTAAMAMLPQQQKSAGKKGAPTRKTAPAQPKPEETPQTFPIERVRVEGSKLYSEDKLVALTGLKAGELGLPKTFEAARDRLVASGAFESVAFRYEPGPEKKGYLVTFEVSDIEQVYAVRFDRLPASDAELRAHLRKALPLFGERIPGTKETLEQARRAVEEYLKSQGKPAAVQARVMSERPQELFVSFHPAGAPPVIAEVQFTGNKVIPTTVLQNTIHAVAVGVEYRETRFRELLDTSIRPLYEQRGRIGVTFPKVDVVPSEGVKGLKATVEIIEGETYSFGGLRVAGTQTMNDELAKIADIKSGDIANMDQVVAAQDRMHRAMKRGGYMRVTSKAERAVDDRKKTVDLTIHVTPGPEYKFAKLHIKGLDLHGEHEMRRIWGMAPGKVFNVEYPDFFLNKIQEDRLFDNLGATRAIVTPNDKDLTVEVTLVFGGIEKKETERKIQF
jgi:outer membrane protein assembly factor BamA